VWEDLERVQKERRWTEWVRGQCGGRDGHVKISKIRPSKRGQVHLTRKLRERKYEMIRYKRNADSRPKDKEIVHARQFGRAVSTDW